MAPAVFRWAVIGPGSIAHRFAEALPAVPGAVLHAVASRDLGRARDFAARYGAPSATDSYEAIASDPLIDAVYIATPHPMHCDPAILCLEHRKPVLVEKPMSVNAVFERRMVDASRRNHTFLMEAMWSRFLPATRHVRELLAAGRIGAPRFLTADFSYSAEPTTSKRNYQSELAGGGLLDVGIYAMALASLVFGPLPDATSSFAHIGETGVDEHAALLLRYPGGGIASLTCGVRALGSGEARLVGTEGRIELKPFWRAESVKLITRDGEETTEFPFEGNGFEYEIREVMDCVRQGRIESPQYPLDESIAIMETMDGFRREWGLVFPME